MNGSLQIRSGNWYASFRINGRQIQRSLKIKALDGSGRQINKRKAEQAMKDLIGEFEDCPQRNDKITVAEYIENWLERKAATVEQNTIEGYRGYAKSHIIPYFRQSGLKLKNVQTKDIEQYYTDKFKDGRLDGKPGGLSVASLKRHKAVLNQAFTDAVHDGLISQNPCNFAKLPKDTSASSPAIKIYTIEQCEKLLQCCEPLLHDMVIVTLYYGLRRSELMGLKWDSIDFEQNTLTINHTKTVQSTVIAKDRTKNASSNRTYPLIEDVKNILLERKQSQEVWRELYGSTYIENNYVFTKEDGSEFYPSYPSQALRKVLAKNGLPHIRWHDLRHSTASILYAKGYSPKFISDWLGHSGITITMDVYTHIFNEQKQQLGESLNGLFVKH